jgi:E3 ubiquitin-protein ligase HUWE1
MKAPSSLQGQKMMKQWRQRVEERMSIPLLKQASATAPRDYAKELAAAREELQASLVKHALRLADFNYEFIEDIRAVFVGDHAKVYSRQLFEDIKKFSPAAYDIYEAPLKVRCRLLAGVLLKVGLKGVDFSEAETTELLDGLLALLLSGPAPGTPEQPVIPKWLSNHLMVTDRVLCSGEDIKAVTVPKQDEEIPSTDLYVGPSYKEGREILFQFCMRLLRIPNLTKEDLLSLIGVLVFLTRDHTVAAEFIKKDGISLLLKYFKANPQPDECTLLVVNIFRHAMEDPATVEDIMRHDFKRWNQVPRSRPADIPTFMRYMQPSALRDPALFLNLTKELCELTEPHPSSGSHRIKFKEQTPTNGDKAETSESVADGNSPKKGDVSMQHKAEPNELVVTVVHYLISEMMSQTKPPTETKESAEGISSTTATTAALATNIDATDTSTSVQEQTAPTLPLPGAPKDLDYPRLITDILTELLLSYDSCKLAFLSYTRKRIANTTSKEKDAMPKVKSPALQYLLQEITSVKGDPSEWPKRQAKINHLHTMIVALCADINVTADLKAVSPVVTAVRKAILDAIAKSIKENHSSNPADGVEARYGRYHALAQVCERLLTVNLHLATTKAYEDSLTHISKLMLEKNFVSILSGILSEIDLNHPLASNLTAAVLAPLENL